MIKYLLGNIFLVHKKTIAFAINCRKCYFFKSVYWYSKNARTQDRVYIFINIFKASYLNI